MGKSLVKDALKLATEKMLNEYYTAGHYPTSDENETSPHSRTSKNNQHGLQIKLSNGDVANCVVVPLTKSIIYGGFNTNGANWIVLELPKTTSGYYNKFKKAIEKEFDTQLVDEKEARENFDHYISLIFT